jgi:hypothetical protein
VEFLRAQKLEDRRKVERLMPRCLKDAENNLLEMNVQRWRKRRIIQNWTRIIKKVDFLRRLQSQGVSE